MARLVQGVNDLASLHPGLAKQLRSIQESGITAEGLSVGSKVKVWWVCETDPRHEWLAAVYDRVIGRGCAVCRGLQVQKGINDLESQFPEVASEWHQSKNGESTPAEYSFGSGFKAWWVCVKGHEWKTTISARTTGSNCPFCTNRFTLKGFNDLQTVNPQLAQEWHPTKNGKLASEVQAGSRGKAWWLCDKGHEWEAQIDPRHSRNVGCPFCTGNKTIRGQNDLATVLPLVAKQWHPIKNGELLATQISAKSSRQVWWICDKGHEWESAPAYRGESCPICINRKLLEGFNDFSTLEPELSKELHPTKNGSFSPSEISVGSEKKVWWVCAQGHEWETGLHVRRMGRGCPICSNNLIQPGFNDMATTRPDLASEWHPSKNGQLLPTQIVAGTSKRIWWLCSDGHEWETTGNYRIIDNTGCPGCAVRGFDATAPGLVYFIEHPGHLARKVGITNTNIRTDRLAGFTTQGWALLKTWSFDEGNSPQKIERIFFRWIRKELNLPMFLGKSEMGGMGGYSETFSKDGPTDAEIIDFIESEIRRL